MDATQQALLVSEIILLTLAENAELKKDQSF
jgi:hypothetical protein